ncbi:MAG: 3-phosphoshikimate 1-carboxyvinyltransferase [Bacteroidetes bacterium]|nr:3-phosphoshikimate 1-carboxyvinyltransferase [Bacteroidota bacterium]
MFYKVSKSNKILKGKIDLVPSKSIANRSLIIQQLCKEKFTIHNLSQSRDTRVLQNIFTEAQVDIDVEAAGTAMRFMTALCALVKDEWTITGTEQMRRRPIGELVGALRELGAKIKYLEKDGFPPLKIQGGNLQGKEISVEAGTSSQFISALLMIGPVIPNGLTLKLTGDVVSIPYINMTLSLMEFFGIDLEVDGNIIMIPEQDYIAKDISIEADWSAASYYYEMAAMGEEVNIELDGLQEDSLQGDAEIASFMEELGVNTGYTETGIILTKGSERTEQFEHSLKEHPDLAQTIFVTCAALGIPAVISGIENLAIKETNRLTALKNELTKFNIDFNHENNSWRSDGRIEKQKSAVEIETYKDHRMAMSFAPLAMVLDTINIQDPLVVEKSYPQYWMDIEKLGFVIKEIG